MNENRLRRLAQWAKTNATECIFPFWTSEYIMDQENGGFYGVVTLDMQRNNSEPRGLTLTGRMLYAFSTAYRVFGDDIYRQRAAYTFHELVTRFYDPEYGGAFTTVTEKGEVLTTDKPNYCEAFLIMGCAAYYHATGDTEALRIAMETFHIMETKVKYAPACYHGNMTRDFQVADGFGFGRKGSKSPFPPDAIVFPHHLCQAYLRLYQATGDPEVGAALRDMVCAVVSSLYDAQYNAEARSQGDVAFTIHEPLGVFANIVPFNYPVELAAHKLAPMLVTGNSVVLLPSSKTPRTAIVIVEQLIKAGVPAKAVSCVTGRGSVIGAAAAADPRVAAVSFTGSTEVGISLAETCAKSLRPVSLELGGNDPLIIFDDCDYALALEEAIGGRIGNAGQTCCASKRFLVQRGIYDRFTSDLADRLTKVKMGNPSDPRVADVTDTVEPNGTNDVPAQLPDGHLRKLDDIVSKGPGVKVRHGAPLPAEIFDHARKNAVRAVGVHMIVIPPDSDAMAVKKPAFFVIYGIGEILKPTGAVLRGVEGRLMNNNQVGVQGYGLFDYIDRRYQRGNNAGAFCLRIAALPVVAAVISRQVGMVGKDFFNDFPVFHELSPFVTAPV